MSIRFSSPPQLGGPVRWASRGGWVALALLLFTAGTSAAQPQRLERVKGPVTLDGMSGEAAWEGVSPLPLVMYEPTFGDAMTERTEIRVAYDDDYFYIAGRMYDSDPSGIRVNSLYRDRSSGDDLLGIVLDSFNDNQNGLWFWTTPAGVRGDAAISNDLSGGINDNWNTYWDVATEQTSEGWFAEARIPFSSIGFQDLDGQVVIGVTVYRYIARKNERHVFPAISPNWDYRRPSLAQKMALQGVYSHKPVHVTPYLLTGFDQTPQFDPASEVFALESEAEGQVGFDAKYNVTSNLTLDLTVNTDFAQVEVDDEQVNLTRFSLFFPEKRQFFQERAGIFDFATGGSTRLFHSRRIGLHEGEPVRILGGVRLVGRQGGWDLGLIEMQTARSEGLPSENFGVFRARRQVLNANSYAGGMVTSRLGGDGSYNFAYGLDTSIRVFGDDYVSVRWAHTFDSDLIQEDEFDAATSGLLRVTWDKRRQEGFTYFFSGRWSGEDYEPGVGFVTRRDFADIFAAFAYSRFLGSEAALRRIDPFQLFGSVVFRNDDGSVESAFVEHDVDFQWKSGANVWGDLELYYEDLREPLDLPKGSQVAEGSYWFYGYEGGVGTPTGALFRAGVNWGVGTFYDGYQVNFGLEPRWNASRFLELSAEYEINFIRFPDRAQGFDAHIVRLRTQAALDTKLSLNAFVQFSNVSDLLSANVRLRYNFREGNDLWVVYDEGQNLDTSLADRVLPRTDRRALRVKYTHTFTW